jgi:hypothetical protein
VLKSGTISLSRAERMELSQRATDQAGRADETRRARLNLSLGAGDTRARIRARLCCDDVVIDHSSKRIADEGLSGLFSRHAGQEPITLGPRLETRILE